jgi:hypothetical protein
MTMIPVRITAAAVAIVLGIAASAAAQARPTQPRPTPPRPGQPRATQPPSDKFYVSIDGMFQTGFEDFSESVTFTENAESGSFSTDYDVKSGPAFNISAGALVWRNVAIGAGVSRYSKATPIQLTAQVPHPFFFNRPREVSGEVGGLKREELAVHVQARVMLTPSPRMQAMIFGGPSFFNVKQGIVNDFEVTEAYPYDTATLSRGLSATVDESKLGFNVGGDVGYFFTRQVGVGGSVQWSGASIDVPASSGNGSFDVRIGGIQAGGGLRLRF